MSDAITAIALHHTTRERYLNYALSVITSRALPDVRDGLKPVQRRILYAMHTNLRLLPDAKHRKSAAVVGEVMAKYHPHGDSSIYDALVRMAQPFSLRYPLVDGQGNFGSLDGDNAAAMRYTECKLRHIAVELADELRKRTVDMRPTYDGTLFEPVVLPAQIPNLLVNGSSGIAVGMATNVPPHHLGEVIAAACAIIDSPQATVEDLVPQLLRGPDFPTGGEILNDVESLRDIYREGRGSVELRGTWALEEDGRRRQIVVTSIPFAIDKSVLIAEIADHVRDGKLPQIQDVRDESTEDVRIVLELRKGADPAAAMSYLYRRTALQTRFHVNLTALVPTADPQVARPERLGLVAMLRHFLDFRMDVVRRRLQFDLDELRRRIHILEGFEIIFDALDEAIALIRRSTGKEDARDRLMERFAIDWDQAEAVLETKLYRLAKLEIDAIRKELAAKRAEAAQLEALLADPAALWRLVRSELSELAAAYGDARRTEVVGPVQVQTFDEEVYILAEDAFAIVSRDGWIKRQRSFGDPASIRVREGDAVGWIVGCSTRETLVVLTDKGRAYGTRVSDLPQTTGFGEYLGARFDLSDGERVVAVWTSDRRAWPGELAKEPAPLLGAVTRAGRVAAIPWAVVAEPSTKAGRYYQRLQDDFAQGDRVLWAGLLAPGGHLAAVSRQGKAVVFPTTEVPSTTAAGRGVTALKLGVGDSVGAAGLLRGAGDSLAVLGKQGNVETIDAQRVRPTARGGKGKPLRLAEVTTPPAGPHVVRLRAASGDEALAADGAATGEEAAPPAAAPGAGGGDAAATRQAAAPSAAPPAPDDLASLFAAPTARWTPPLPGLGAVPAAPTTSPPPPSTQVAAPARLDAGPSLRPTGRPGASSGSTTSAGRKGPAKANAPLWNLLEQRERARQTPPRRPRDDDADDADHS